MSKLSKKDQEKKTIELPEQEHEYERSSSSSTSVLSESSTSSGNATNSLINSVEEKALTELSKLREAVNAVYNLPEKDHKKLSSFSTTNCIKNLEMLSNEAKNEAKTYIADIIKFKMLAKLKKGQTDQGIKKLNSVEDIYKDNPKDLLKYYKNFLIEVGKETENDTSKNLIQFMEKKSKEVVNKIASLTINILEGLTEQLRKLQDMEEFNMQKTKEIVQEIEQYLADSDNKINSENVLKLQLEFCNILQNLAKRDMNEENYQNAVDFFEFAEQNCKNVSSDNDAAEKHRELASNISRDLAIAYALRAHEIEIGKESDSKEYEFVSKSVTEFAKAVEFHGDKLFFEIQDNFSAKAPYVYILGCLAQGYFDTHAYLSSINVCNEAISKLQDNLNFYSIDSYSRERIAITLYDCGKELYQFKEAFRADKADTYYSKAVDCYLKAFATNFNFGYAKELLKDKDLKDKVSTSNIIKLIQSTETQLQNSTTKSAQKDIEEFYNSEIPAIMIKAYNNTGQYEEAKQYADKVVSKDITKIIEFPDLYAEIANRLTGNPDLSNEARNVSIIGEKLKQIMDIHKILLGSREDIKHKLEHKLSSDELDVLIKLKTPTAMPRQSYANSHEEFQENHDSVVNELKSIYPTLPELDSDEVGVLGEY